MAKYKLLEKAYCKQTPGDVIEQTWEAGTEIELRDDATPGPHMEPLDTAARTAMAKYLKEGAPLDRRIVAAINQGVPVLGGTLPAIGDQAGSQATIELMQKLMQQQLEQNIALTKALQRLAA